MKKIIALVLVLVMVLSLSTVAFAEHEPYGGTLVSDTVNVVRRILGYADEWNVKWHVKMDSAFGSLINTVVTYHDDVVSGIAYDGITTMADSFHSVNTKYPVVDCVAHAIGWCVERVANSFHYGHAIIGRQPA